MSGSNTVVTGSIKQLETESGREADDSLYRALEKYQDFLCDYDLDENESEVVLEQVVERCFEVSQTPVVSEECLFEVMYEFGCHEIYEDCHKMASGILGRDITETDI